MAVERLGAEEYIRRVAEMVCRDCGKTYGECMPDLIEYISHSVRAQRALLANQRRYRARHPERLARG